LDNYLGELFANEVYGREQSADWMDDLGLSTQFAESAKEIHAKLLADGETFSLTQVERALRSWLESATEDLVTDAAHHVLRPSSVGWPRFRAALEHAAQSRAFEPLPSPEFEHIPAAEAIYRGHRPFSAAALKEMIVFFASKPGGILKTKLNKLLWYSDFLNFRQRAISLSGATYVHLPYGPVPDRYESFVTSLCREGVLSLTKRSVGEFTGESLQATREADFSALDAGAVDVLEAVYRRFARLGSREISDISHREPGYVETESGETISYSYARSLQAVIPPVRGKW
jgi:hypothetical protein